MRYIYLILIAFLLSYCAPAGDPQPANLLPEDKMTQVMMDIHLAEARLESAGLGADSADVIFKKMQQDIFKKHQIKEVDFNNSYQYYLRNLNEFDKIYQKVIDSLSARETLFNARNKK